MNLREFLKRDNLDEMQKQTLLKIESRGFWGLWMLLLAALIALEDRDRQLITALFYDRLSTREYARRIGVTQRAVIKRRDRILRDMKKHFEKFAA